MQHQETYRGYLVLVTECDVLLEYEDPFVFEVFDPLDHDEDIATCELINGGGYSTMASALLVARKYVDARYRIDAMLATL
jgi:hypothetical protein